MSEPLSKYISPAQRRSQQMPPQNNELDWTQVKNNHKSNDVKPSFSSHKTGSRWQQNDNTSKPDILSTQQFHEQKQSNTERRPLNSEQRTFNGEQRSFNGERRPFNGEPRSFNGERKPFNDEQRPFNGERKPFNDERRTFNGERKPFNDEQRTFNGERKPFNGERRPFNEEQKTFNSEQRSYKNDHGPFDNQKNNSKVEIPEVMTPKPVKTKEEEFPTLGGKKIQNTLPIITKTDSADKTDQPPKTVWASVVAKMAKEQKEKEEQIKIMAAKELTLENQRKKKEAIANHDMMPIMPHKKQMYVNHDGEEEEDENEFPTGYENNDRDLDYYVPEFEEDHYDENWY